MLVQHFCALLVIAAHAVADFAHVVHDRAVVAQTEQVANAFEAHVAVATNQVAGNLSWIAGRADATLAQQHVRRNAEILRHNVNDDLRIHAQQRSKLTVARKLFTVIPAPCSAAAAVAARVAKV